MKRMEVAQDPDDCIESILDEENDWLDFFYYCIDMTALNLLYIAQFEWKEISSRVPKQLLSEVVNKAL